jgi:hypothetical protein
MSRDPVLLPELCGELAQLGLGSRDQRDIPLVGGEETRELEADAARCAGDEGCTLHPTMIA